ncbi:hypothetical protein PINS_up021941 [Pythium insidiosum]|nr:hypothetical protein PINS_up021941 [Pythium insidiosum]
MANLFIKHTSASLSLNENCDPDVRCVTLTLTVSVSTSILLNPDEQCSTDMEGALNRIVPESWNK